MVFKKENTALSDEELMKRSVKGDTSAFTTLYDRYAEKMARYFARMLWNDREKALDFTQDLFTKIINKPELYKADKKFSTWIYSIASNMCKNEYRHHEVKRKHQESMPVTSYTSTDWADNNVDHGNFKKSLDEKLAKLDCNQRSTFIMRYKQGLSIKQIADVMNCSEGTVKSRLFYTLKKLAKELNEFDPKNLN